MPGLFVGVEFPIAFNSYEEGKLALAHRPGVRLQPGTWYESRKAVYGLTPAGEESRSFRRYIALHRPKPRGVHVNYNSWWTSPMPYYTENDILELMDVLDTKFVEAHGVALDSFCIDLGWSQPKSIWEIDAKSFPEGFTRLQNAARKMHSNLGLWISPSSYYPPALDGDWAQSHGYEVIENRLLCLGGKRYADRFKARLADLVGRYGINHLKLDGYAAECSQPDHGHEPGDLSAEPIAEGIIAAMEAARGANPNVWLETTCFGWHASPWWLFHANSVLGAHGDDAPFGRCPAPVYRESYTTARDFFNLQGAYLLPTPVVAQEVFGIIHQTPRTLSERRRDDRHARARVSSALCESQVHERCPLECARRLAALGSQQFRSSRRDRAALAGELATGPDTAVYRRSGHASRALRLRAYQERCRAHRVAQSLACPAILCAEIGPATGFFGRRQKPIGGKRLSRTATLWPTAEVRRCVRRPVGSLRNACAGVQRSRVGRPARRRSPPIGTLFAC